MRHVQGFSRAKKTKVIRGHKRADWAAEMKLGNGGEAAKTESCWWLLSPEIEEERKRN